MELPALINALQIPKYHLLGHSWGTIVAQKYVIDFSQIFRVSDSNVTADQVSQPQSLILSGPLSDAQLYINAQWDPEVGTVGRSPVFVQKRIHELENARMYNSEEYKMIVDVLTTRFTYRTAPPPDCVSESFASLNTEVYVALQGASEFTVGGALGVFNCTGELGKVRMPTLLTAGEHDTMRPPVLDVIETAIKRTRRVTFKGAAHLSMVDTPGEMNDVVATFLGDVENGWDDGNVGRAVLNSEENAGVMKVVSSRGDGVGGALQQERQWLTLLSFLSVVGSALVAVVWMTNTYGRNVPQLHKYF